MPLDYWIDPRQDLLVTRAYGPMTDDVILEYMQRLVDDEDWRSGMNGIVDAREIEGFDVTADAMKRASEIATIGEERFAGSRWAVISDLDAVFGMTRMYTLRRDPKSYEIQVFRAPEPACAWLRVEPPFDRAPD